MDNIPLTMAAIKLYHQTMQETREKAGDHEAARFHRRAALLLGDLQGLIDGISDYKTWELIE